jgi:hypothetical protein
MKMEEIKSGNCDSSVSVVTRRRDEPPRNHGSIFGMGKIFFLHLSMQTGCGAHPASCPGGGVGFRVLSAVLSLHRMF